MRVGTLSRPVRVAAWAVVLVLALQFLLPPAAGALLTRLLRTELSAGGSVRVQVTSVPALELLGGRIDRLQIEARGVLLDDLTVDTLLAQVNDLWVDLPALLQGRFARRRQGEARARLVFTEEGLNQYLWSEVDASRRFRIRLSPDGAALEGSLLGEILPVRVEGEILLQGPAQIRFEPRRISVREAELPPSILQILGEELVFPVAVDELPLSLGLEELSVGDGWLVATGSSDAVAQEEGRDGGA